MVSLERVAYGVSRAAYGVSKACRILESVVESLAAERARFRRPKKGLRRPRRGVDGLDGGGGTKYREFSAAAAPRFGVGLVQLVSFFLDSSDRRIGVTNRDARRKEGSELVGKTRRRNARKKKRNTRKAACFGGTKRVGVGGGVGMDVYVVERPQGGVLCASRFGCARKSARVRPGCWRKSPVTLLLSVVVLLLWCVSLLSVFCSVCLVLS